MTPEIDRELRANHILRNAGLYGSDEDFRKMVDNTVYFTSEEKEKAQLEVDRVYGFDVTRDDPAYTEDATLEIPSMDDEDRQLLDAAFLSASELSEGGL